MCCFMFMIKSDHDWRQADKLISFFFLSRHWSLRTVRGIRSHDYKGCSVVSILISQDVINKWYINQWMEMQQNNKNKTRFIIKGSVPLYFCQVKKQMIHFAAISNINWQQCSLLTTWLSAFVYICNFILFWYVCKRNHYQNSNLGITEVHKPKYWYGLPYFIRLLSTTNLWLRAPGLTTTQHYN